MSKPVVYKLTHVGDGLYMLRDGKSEIGVFRLSTSDFKSFFDIFEGELYNWTQTEKLEDEDGEVFDVPFPDGSLVRVDHPNVVVYQYQAWPVVVAGKDKPKMRELHKFKD